MESKQAPANANANVNANVNANANANANVNANINNAFGNVNANVNKSVSIPLPPVEAKAPVVEAKAPEVKKRVFKVALPATTPAPAAAAEPVKVRAPRKIKVVSERQSEESATIQSALQSFYKKRGKAKKDYFKTFAYTPEGNLIDTSQDPANVIALRRFRPLSDEERQRIDETRLQSIIDAEKAFDTARDKLRTAYNSYKEKKGSAADVVRLNKIVKTAEEVRNKAIYPQRYITVVSNPEIRSVIFEQKYEQRKLGHPVYLLKYLPYSKENAFGQYATPEETEESKRGGGIEENGLTVLSTLIESPEDKDLGYLHPCFMKDFTYGGITYAFPLQAYEATRLKGLKQDAMVDEIMKTRSPRTVKNIAARDSTPAQNAYELWSAILKAYYQQHQDLAKKLEETGDNIFRLSENAPATSQYLRALFSLRASLRESQPVDIELPVSTGGVITEEEQRRNKVAAILRAKGGAFNKN